MSFLFSSVGASSVPRMDYHQFSPALAAGQPLVSPMNIPQGPVITVTTGGQGVQQGGMKMVPQTVVNHMMKVILYWSHDCFFVPFEM